MIEWKFRWAFLTSAEKFVIKLLINFKSKSAYTQATGKAYEPESGRLGLINYSEQSLCGVTRQIPRQFGWIDREWWWSDGQNDGKKNCEVSGSRKCFVGGNIANSQKGVVRKECHVSNSWLIANNFWLRRVVRKAASHSKHRNLVFYESLESFKF